jgi:hypothetical protein
MPDKAATLGQQRSRRIKQSLGGRYRPEVDAMYDAPYELGAAADGYPVHVRARGRSVLTNPMLNRGTAFTPEQRQLLKLQGLLPSGVSTLEGQLRPSKAEAVPEDLILWTDGRALVATGSPFPPVGYGGRTYTIAQANNALVFPGLGLGVAVVRARGVTDAMIAAAADAVAALADPTGSGGALLPPVTDLRTVSAAVAIAVAQAADEHGLSEQPLTNPVKQIHEAMWRPEYPPFEPI